MLRVGYPKLYSDGDYTVYWKYENLLLLYDLHQDVLIFNHLGYQTNLMKLLK